MIDSYIKAVVDYAVEAGLTDERDRIYCINKLLALFGKETYDINCEAAKGSITELLNALCDHAAEKNMIENTVTARDLFDTKIMGELMPPPSVICQKFEQAYTTSPKAATDWFYDISRKSNYIRLDRISKNVIWKYSDPVYGVTDITVNLSKPEKTTAEIEAAKKAPKSSYPKCMLCKESEGYAGTLTFPARQNHRIIPLKLAGEDFYFQYSPYVYYNEHCIVLNKEHTPMVINRKVFEKLLDFVTLYPHYFLGSNADLPIVGGSILSHEHFQGGCYEFAMQKAPIDHKLEFSAYPEVKAGLVQWPMATVRLTSENKALLIELADKILNAWREYTDESAFIFAYTKGENGERIPHNTVTPIARRRGKAFELDLVLRNNLTTAEHPQGVYHPHKELHHIKQENIGLIEVMGLAVLPARLKTEMESVKAYLVNGSELTVENGGEKHRAWADEIKLRYSVIDENNADQIVKDEIGRVFSTVLEHAGVYKRTDEGIHAFLRFIATI